MQQQHRKAKWMYSTCNERHALFFHLLPQLIELASNNKYRVNHSPRMLKVKDPELDQHFTSHRHLDIWTSRNEKISPTAVE
jgi:HEPN domain-containing protein